MNYFTDRSVFVHRSALVISRWKKWGSGGVVAKYRPGGVTSVGSLSWAGQSRGKCLDAGAPCDAIAISPSLGPGVPVSKGPAKLDEKLGA